jgi:hypothetical protein
VRDAHTVLRKAAQLLDAAAALALSLGDAGRAVELADRAHGLTGAGQPVLARSGRRPKHDGAQQQIV